MPGIRITVEFSAGASAQVLAFFLQSTMGKAQVEVCVTLAVHRWEFPISYPFDFTPASGIEPGDPGSNEAQIVPPPPSSQPQ